MSKSKKNKKENITNKYDAENEIIIGVTTKPKQPKERKQSKNKKVIKEKNKNLKTKEKKNKVKYKDPKKEELIKKKNRKIRLISILIVIFIAICGTIYYLTTPRFNISNIVIYGSEKNSDDTYISLSKIKLDETNIFQITKNMINNRLKENSYVESANIKRKFPNTLEIYVEERKVAYQIEYNGKYIYINNQGYILETNDENKDVVKIVGIDNQNGELEYEKRLNNNELLKLGIISKIINNCKNNNIENKITKIDVGNTSNYTLYFEEEDKIAYLGDASNLNERILLLKAVLQKEKKSKGKIFINGDLSKDKVYFKPNK